MSINPNRQGEQAQDDRNNAAGAQQENPQQMGDSLSGSIQTGQNQQNQQSQQGSNLQGGQQSSQIGGRDGGEQSSQEGAEQTLSMGSQQSGGQGNAQRGAEQALPIDPEDKPAEELSPEELRLMADTMPGEGPGDD